MRNRFNKKYFKRTKIEIDERYNWQNVYICPACESFIQVYGRYVPELLFRISSAIIIMTFFLTLFFWFENVYVAFIFVAVLSPFDSYIHKRNRCYRLVKKYE